MLRINHSIEIPESEFTITFARSSGPGGQNVNKVNSKAVLHWNVLESPSIPADLVHRFCTRFANRMTREGMVVIASEEHRNQKQNRDACLEKLRKMILAVRYPPKPRKKTKATKASKERRLQGKKVRSRVKSGRGRVREE